MTNNDDWKDLWGRHANAYINTLPRTGIFMRHFISKIDFGRILELAAGSCIESFHLQVTLLNILFIMDC